MPSTFELRPGPLRLFADRPSPRLYDTIVEVLRVRHYSRRTEEAYLHWMRRFIEFHQHQRPRQLAEADVNRFLTHLAVQERVAASTQNHAISLDVASSPGIEPCLFETQPKSIRHVGIL